MKEDQDQTQEQQAKAVSVPLRGSGDERMADPKATPSTTPCFSPLAGKW